MIYRIYEKHVVDRTARMPLAMAVERYLGGDWSELIAEQTWPTLEELLGSDRPMSRAELRRRLAELAGKAVAQRLDAIEEESASDEEIHELALDDVQLEFEDCSAIEAHLGERLLADALSVYGEALASRIAEGASA